MIFFFYSAKKKTYFLIEEHIGVLRIKSVSMYVALENSMSKMTYTLLNNQLKILHFSNHDLFTISLHLLAITLILGCLAP